MLSELIEYRDYTIEVHTDDDPMNPRKDFDPLGTMVCWHSRYDLGDEHSHGSVRDFFESLAMELKDSKGNSILSDNQYNNIEEIEDARLGAIVSKHVVMLELFLYDHSGITMRTGAFSCPWDSGQVGFIYMTKEKALKEYGGKIFSKQLKTRIKTYMEGEVETYDNFLTGNVYGYVVKDADGEDIEDGSCWGYFGYDHKGSGLLEQAEDAIDYEIKDRKKKHYSKLKAWIKNNVPLINRIPCPVIA